jgi:hypothetical protein
VGYVADHWGELGLSSNVVTALNVAKGDWDKQYAEHMGARAASTAARTSKNASRADFDRLIREVARRIQAYPNATNTHRAGLGITVRDAVRMPRPPR